jgi:hypothetical protein
MGVGGGGWWRGHFGGWRVGLFEFEVEDSIYNGKTTRRRLALQFFFFNLCIFVSIYSIVVIALLLVFAERSRPLVCATCMIIA